MNVFTNNFLMIKLEHINLDGFQCVIVHFGAFLSSACGGSFYVTLITSFYFFLIWFLFLIAIYSSHTFYLISAYLHFSHISCYNIFV